MDESNYMMSTIILAILLIGAIIVIFGIAGNIRELGQSICEEEYNADFASYDAFDNTLRCEDKEPKQYYDGLRVEVI